MTTLALPSIFKVIKHKPNIIAMSQTFITRRYYTSEGVQRNTANNNSKNNNDSHRELHINRLRSTDELNALMQKLHYSNMRNSETIIIEGRKFIEEALMCNLQLRSLIFSKIDIFRSLSDDVCQQLKSKKNLSIYKVAHHDLKIWSVLSHPPGIFGIFEKPSQKGVISKLQTTKLPITVICDNIRDPNNLGSIIRTCAAVGCENVMLTPGCCDPWQTKALRGGCGGHFRIPIMYGVTWNDLTVMVFKDNHSPLNYCVFLAESNLYEMNDIALINLENLKEAYPHNIVIVGGETHGLSKQAYNFLAHMKQKRVHIPVLNGMDSLNAVSALTLILYKLKESLTLHPISN